MANVKINFQMILIDFLALRSRSGSANLSFILDSELKPRLQKGPVDPLL